MFQVAVQRCKRYLLIDGLPALNRGVAPNLGEIREDCGDMAPEQQVPSLPLRLGFERLQEAHLAAGIDREGDAVTKQHPVPA